VTTPYYTFTMPTDQRADDQDTAIEQAFVAGTLPEEDRRDEPVADAPVAAPVEPSAVESTPSATARILALLDLMEQETGYARRALIADIRFAVAAIGRAISR
jgi:hypothetical protein